ncbi:MAG: AAA family ATPase [Myxococcota bacterium]
MIRQLPPKKLRRRFSRNALVRQAMQKKQSKSKTQNHLEAMRQNQSLSALELGLGIKQRGYNIFAVGVSGTGRTSVVNDVLLRQARKEPTPDDIVLLYNFSDRDRPLSLSIPAGSGPALKKTYDSLVEKMLVALEKAFDSELYDVQHQRVQEKCRRQTQEALEEIEQEARCHGFVLVQSASCLTLTPADAEGKSITEEEFDKMPHTRKRQLEKKAERLEKRLEETFRKVRSAEKESEEALEQLQRQTGNNALATLFESACATWKQVPQVIQHLKAIREDVLNRLRHFIPQERPATSDSNIVHMINNRRFDEDEEFNEEEALLGRYRVNVLVSHRKGSGAPVVQETHPTASNIIGRIEQHIRAGETVTDFTRIHAGALYRANGGYLIIDAGDLLRDLGAWEGLKRSLKNQAIELDDPGEPGRMVSVAALRPEPVPLSLKVVLIGTPEVYYTISCADPDFDNLFKVKADFDSEVQCTHERTKKYIHFLVNLCEQEKLCPLTPESTGRVMEHATRLAGNQNKITARLGELADLVREASFWARKEKSKRIDVCHVRKALKARSDRNGFLQTHMLEDILEGRICIETQGKVVGQCNALTVVELGGYEFGTPLRITCRTGCGRGEIVDIERETKLGGPIHTKGTLILRGLLADRFGRDVPLGFCATLCMEQTYSDVDGDSASLAEACALLSALSQAPLDQSLALTGSIDQRGRVQAVGSVNEKIEGFFRLCQERFAKTHKIVKSETSSQQRAQHQRTQCPKTCGVIIPAANAAEVMLAEEVVEACNAGWFSVYTVDSFEDALQLLTQRPWKQGQNALYPAICKTLQQLNQIRTCMQTQTKSLPPASQVPYSDNASLPL